MYEVCMFSIITHYIMKSDYIIVACRAVWSQILEWCFRWFYFDGISGHVM